jgi:glutamate-1-semialdehyde 2,1-aminomutase
VATSPGVPRSFLEQTIVCKYNDLESVKKAFMQSGPNIAAVIVEPIAANMGLVKPKPGFLQGLRDITSLYGSLLIFDEVITGFRTCYGGVQNQLQIKPDLTTLGKIIGGGLPVGAYGGRQEIMNRVAPAGDVYQAGTLSGNPLAMAAGAATLKLLRNEEFYDDLDEKTAQHTDQINNLCRLHKVDCCINQQGSIFSIFFTNQDVIDYESVLSCDTDQYASFFKGMLEAGVYFPPSQYEVCFVSSAHAQRDLEHTVQAVSQALRLV